MFPMAENTPNFCSSERADYASVAVASRWWRVAVRRRSATTHIMENHDYIEKAKSHLAGTVAPHATPPSPDDFPRVRVRETVLVEIGRASCRERVWLAEHVR